MESNRITAVRPTCPYCGGMEVKERSGHGWFCPACDRYVEDEIRWIKKAAREGCPMCGNKNLTETDIMKRKIFHLLKSYTGYIEESK